MKTESKYTKEKLVKEEAFDSFPYLGKGAQRAERVGPRRFKQFVDRRETPLNWPGSINEAELPGREGAPSRSLTRYLAKPSPLVCEPSHRHPALIRAGISSRSRYLALLLDSKLIRQPL